MVLAVYRARRRIANRLDAVILSPFAPPLRTALSAASKMHGHEREISELGNVFRKLSGLVAYADPARWSPADLRPYVEHVIECFGWDRVMFGSDWPVCTLSATLKQWVNTLLLLTQSGGEENRSKLFYDNAAAVYRLTVC